MGARPFLIAYNINLESQDIDLAKEIAKRVRERTGGLPRVQALGLFLDDLNCAQVSMNLLDFSVTPMWRVWEAVRDAAAASVAWSCDESELIGLAPIAALLDVADHIDVDAALDDVAAHHTRGRVAQDPRLRSVNGPRDPSRRGRAGRRQ